MHTTIITGTSGGLGEALAQQLLAKGHRVVGLSRRDNAALQHERFSFHACDLNQGQAVLDLGTELFARIAQDSPSALTLINNAAVHGSCGSAGQMNLQDAEDTLKINLLSPLYLCELFIKQFQDVPGQKTILNISSGAAEVVLTGGSPYCASKAGLEMLSTCLHTEQQAQAHPVYVHAVRPGVVDTPMQAQLRDLPEPYSNFAKQYHDEGLLRSADDVARDIISQYLG